MHQFDSNVSEFSSATEADVYTLRLRMQIEQRLAENKQFIPHDQVMANVDALLGKLTKKIDAASYEGDGKKFLI